MGDTEWGLMIGLFAGLCLACAIGALVNADLVGQRATFSATRAAVRSQIDTALLLAPDIAPAGVVWACCEVTP